MAFDAKKLSRTDWTVVGAGAVALISLFLPWFGESYGPYSASQSGWGTSWGWIGGLIIVAAGLYLLLLRSGADFSKVKMGPAVIVLGAAVLGTLIVIIRWIDLPSGSFAGVSWGPDFGIFLTIIAGVAQCVAAFLLFRASGEKLPWDAGTTAAPPPPSTPPTSPPPV